MIYFAKAGNRAYTVLPFLIFPDVREGKIWITPARISKNLIAQTWHTILHHETNSIERNNQIPISRGEK